MENFKILVITFFSWISGNIIYQLGGYDKILQALILFMIVDYLTGVMNSIKSNSLNSKKGWFGFFKKIITLLLIAVANNIQLITEDIFPLRHMVVMGFIANEVVSILENSASFGVKYPEKVIKILEQLKDSE